MCADVQMCGLVDFLMCGLVDWWMCGLGGVMMFNWEASNLNGFRVEGVV